MRNYSPEEGRIAYTEDIVEFSILRHISGLQVGEGCFNESERFDADSRQRVCLESCVCALSEVG
jgi:hypothetical protein